MRLWVPTRMRMRLRGTRLASWYAWAHQCMYRLTGGWRGATVQIGPNGETFPVLVLETVGRKSGAVRRTPLLYLEHDDTIVLAAANAGHPRHPMWYLNLLANPQATAQIGRRRFAVTAEETTGTHRRDLWNMFVARYEGLALYAEGLQRTIPMIALHRVRD